MGLDPATSICAAVSLSMGVEQAELPERPGWHIPQLRWHVLKYSDGFGQRKAARIACRQKATPPIIRGGVAHRRRKGMSKFIHEDCHRGTFILGKMQGFAIQ
jgi:hypothetical protein